jgi:hypothetical protein
MHALPQTVPVPFFSQHIQEGAFRPGDQVTAGTQGLLDELLKWATALKSLRTEEARAAQDKAA